MSRFRYPESMPAIAPPPGTARFTLWWTTHRVWAVGLVIIIALLLAAAVGAQQPAARGAPAAGRGVATPTAPVDTTPHMRNVNWLTDRRPFAVGDVIKVSVDEFALATANTGTTSQASRKRQMDLGIVPPSTGGKAMSPIDGSVQSSDAGESKSTGEATRNTRYLGDIPVQIVSITPEGLLKVKGQKTIDVDNNKQEMTLTGTVRPQDVSSSDVVPSSAVADAQIVYKSRGGLDKPKSGLFGKIIGIFWP